MQAVEPKAAEVTELADSTHLDTPNRKDQEEFTKCSTSKITIIIDLRGAYVHYKP